MPDPTSISTRRRFRDQSIKGNTIERWEPVVCPEWSAGVLLFTRNAKQRADVMGKVPQGRGVAMLLRLKSCLEAHSTGRRLQGTAPRVIGILRYNQPTLSVSSTHFVGIGIFNRRGNYLSDKAIAFGEQRAA
jgi:hypothetical protein